MSWPANSIRSLQTALKEGKCITTIPTVTFQPPVLCTQAFHNLEAAPSNLAAYSRCCFMNLLRHFLSLAQESELPGTAVMDSPGAEKKAIVLCCSPPHGAISCRELPSHSHESQVVLLTLREPLWNRRALWSSLALVNHAEQHTDTRQWEWRAGSVNASRDVSKHKVIKYSYQGMQENLWELARQSKSGQLSRLFCNRWGDIGTFRYHSTPTRAGSRSRSGASNLTSAHFLPAMTKGVRVTSSH